MNQSITLTEEEQSDAKEVILKAIDMLWDGNGNVINININREKSGEYPLFVFLRSAVATAGSLLGKPNIASLVIDLINADLGNKFSLAEVAQARGVDPQVFRKQYAYSLISELTPRQEEFDF